MQLKFHFKDVSETTGNWNSSGNPNLYTAKWLVSSRQLMNVQEVLTSVCFVPWELIAFYNFEILKCRSKTSTTQQLAIKRPHNHKHSTFEGLTSYSQWSHRAPSPGSFSLFLLQNLRINRTYLINEKLLQHFHQKYNLPLNHSYKRHRWHKS